MRTTFDLPDPRFRDTHSLGAEQGANSRDLVASGDEAGKSGRAPVPSGQRQAAPVLTYQDLLDMAP